ncbi:rho GTPase-activating protein 4-like isoform X2 [Cydia pomonella]|uniref:rho GTPase-activating protein 4-like isoform X2 n=1 Tax=Cydia pomonella TaxID=82600 RepID=UPI002ADDE67A|nr:rho GTPase-activating protein 4-like isoform X2 [Cydia pomonella]
MGSLGEGGEVPDPRRLRGSPRRALPSAGTAMFHCIVQPRHDWGPLDDANAFPDIRVQLTEQTRILEARAEAAAGVAAELHDYCRRRAELEAEYSRALDKLVRAAHQKHKEQKHKREQWSLTGAYACWQAALDSTRSLSKDHAALAALYGGQLASRLQRAADDALRLHRKCRDIVLERHEEVGAALADAAAAGKAQAAAAAEWRAAAAKLRHAHDQKTRLAAADPPRVKKLKALDKELEKRRGRHSEARAKALRARADYVLSLEAANATLQRYYLDDIPDIMLCMEVGFEAVVGRCVRTAAEAEAARAAALCAAAGALRGAASALDSLKDRQKTLDAHAPTFALPRPLPYQGTPPEEQDQEMRELVNGAAEEQDAAAAAVAAELAQRLQQLESGARALRAECRESAKTLDAAEAELVKQMEGSPAQWETARLFGPDAPAPPPPDDQEGPRKEQEDYYLAKFRSYVSSAGRLARLESKAACMRARLVRLAPAPPASPPSPPRRAAARLRRGQFAAPLDDHLAAARADLPRVLTSCVRVISSYGLRHQGIFRVSGSQVEMQALRAAFERGEDPLAHVRDASDINSVCGLLKLYLRELRPPLLPPQLQEHLLRLAALPSDADFVRRMRELLATLPASSVLVLRYLLAFLAHLTEYSEYNMMDAWNLAICVGPTLLAAWGEGGAQLAAQNLVNELVKRTIIHHAAIFPQDIAPHALYKRPSEENETVAEEGESAAGSDDVDAAEEPDVNDDLSLYDDDEENDDDEISDDGENGEWRERDRDSIERRSESLPRRQSVPAPQVREPSPAAPAPSTSAQCRRLAEATPDLVLDLPARAPTEASAPPADAAETFASNRDTLKKRPSHKPSSSDSSTIAPDDPPDTADKPDEAETSTSASAAPESPVPARNTARVAAKFADLTLTGGSLKPALAAKPALLRRPTPHPQHARPQPPPDETT